MRLVTCSHGENLGTLPDSWSNHQIMEEIRRMNELDPADPVAVIIYEGTERIGSFYIDEDGNEVWKGAKVE